MRFPDETVVSTLVLNLDDSLKLRLDSLAAHNRKPLPDWVAKQLRRLAADEGEIPTATYSAEWIATFGSIDDLSFRAHDPIHSPSLPPIPFPPSFTP